MIYLTLDFDIRINVQSGKLVSNQDVVVSDAFLAILVMVHWCSSETGQRVGWPWMTSSQTDLILGGLKCIDKMYDWQ